jgi:hypothetical protein
MTPQSVQMLLALALGFAVAGLCSSGYEVLTKKTPSLHLLTAGPRAIALAGLAVLLFCAPLLIMKNTLVRTARPPFQFVFFATVISGFWSLMSGMLVVMTLQACGLLLA